jgi:two-component system sensor histidine kinase YesM
VRQGIRSFKQRAENVSLKTKLFFILAAISILPIVVVSYSSLDFMFRSSTEHSASISSQYVQFVSRDIDNYLQDLGGSFDELITNPNFQKFMETDEDDLVSQANTIIQFQPIIKKPLPFHNEVLGVLYLDRKGKSYFYSYQKELDPAYDFQKEDLFKPVYQMTKPELSAPHTMSYTLIPHDNVFSFVRPIVNLNTGEISSWLVIDIREDKIRSMLSGTGYVQKGNLLLDNKTKGTSVSNVPIDASVLQDFRKSSESASPADNEFIFTSHNGAYEATYADIPYGDWTLVWLAPLRSINDAVKQSYTLSLIITLATLAISLIIAFPVMRYVLLPLYKLKEGMQRLGRGDYTPIEIRHSNDEIGFLITSFNHTLHELQRMEQEVFHTKMKEKERELLQLQAQINPHFLFNTLETIESYAFRNNSEAVGEMVQSVSRMMRYNVRQDRGWSPLKDEIVYIRNFLKIHYYRNGRDVTAQFELDPESLDIPIMKLSIQPFVENAIKYGWSPKMSTEQFVLTIKTEIRASLLYITVADTGTGLSPEVLEKYNQLFRSQGESFDPYFEKHTGIYNVYRRFLLAYGRQVNFTLSSASNRGTTVEISIPYRKQKADLLT